MPQDDMPPIRVTPVGEGCQLTLSGPSISPTHQATSYKCEYTVLSCDHLLKEVDGQESVPD